AAKAVVARSRFAVLGLVGLLDAEIRQGIDPGEGTQVDAPTVTAVATVGAAQGYKLLAPETGATPAPVASLDPDPSLIDKCHSWPFSSKALGPCRGFWGAPRKVDRPRGCRPVLQRRGAPGRPPAFQGGA